jgi:hypothetical protein
VICDASGVAIGEVLNQVNKPISYFSENLNETTRKYSMYDKEFYAIIQALKKWRHYLVPREFVSYSDNQALQFITRHEKLNQRHAEWVEFMHNFTFVIKHIAWNDNKVVDALRRKCLILQEFQVGTLGFEHLKDMYYDETYFKEAYEACEKPVL